MGDKIVDGSIEWIKDKDTGEVVGYKDASGGERFPFLDLADVQAVADAAESTLSRVSPLILESAVSYDALGRVSVANGWTYTYSASGLLASATDGTYTRTYTYDSSGRYTGFTEV